MLIKRIRIKSQYYTLIIAENKVNFNIFFKKTLFKKKKDFQNKDSRLF